MRKIEIIKEKIKKLFALASDEASSKHEVENALKKANLMMIKYNIEKNDIDVDNNEYGIIQKQLLVQVDTKMLSDWRWSLIAVIGKYNMVHVMGIKRNDGIIQLRLTGSEENIDFTHSIFSLCEKKFINLLNINYKELCKERKKYVSDKLNRKVTVADLQKMNLIESKRVFSTSYIMGCIQGVNSKFEDNINDLDVNEQEKYGLVLSNNNLVVNEFISKFNIKKKEQRSVKINKSAYESGFEDGKNYDRDFKLNK